MEPNVSSPNAPAHRGGGTPEPAEHNASVEISPLSVANMLLRHARTVVLLPVIIATAAALAYWLRPAMYEAESTFIPQLAERNPSGLSGLAQQFGFNVGTLAGSEPLQLYAALTDSRDLLRAVALSRYDLPASEKQGPFSGTLTEYYAEGRTGEAAVRRTIRVLTNRISTTSDLSAGIVTLRTEAELPELAEQINRTVLEFLNRFNLERRQSHAAAERQFIETRMQEAAEQLATVERNLREFLEQNRSFNQSPELVFEADRLRQAVTLHRELYSSLAQAYERARIEEVRNIPVLTVIEQPEGSARSARAGVAVPLMLGLFAGVAVAVALVLLIEYAGTLRVHNAGEFEQFQRLRRQLVPSRVRRLFVHMRSARG